MFRIALIRCLSHLRVDRESLLWDLGRMDLADDTFRMLNLLLGVGGSGTYHMLASPSRAPVRIHFSPTLAVSAGGLVFMLLATAIFVPLNGYLVDRRWACFLIVAYLAVMAANVAVEVKTGRT